MNKESIKSILNPGATYKIRGKLWIECNGKKFFGPGPVELLTLIDQTGSINKAAKEMNMSYKKAWEIINALNELVVHPLVITQSGGEKGGGSVITGEARRLIKYHKQLRERFDAFLEKETTEFSS
ncbi:MAG TPA: winged helix-turn-helix domain-containing protein [Parafilimonas sp.]|nr:winged helix-turn-helix domain-containing protein [Parafilimonas sp.]